MDAVGFGCAEMDDDDLVLGLLKALSSPPLDTVIEKFPAGPYIMAGIDLAIALLETDTSGMDEILIKYPGYLYDPSSTPPET